MRLRACGSRAYKHVPCHFFYLHAFCDRTPILRSQPNPSLRPSCSIPEIHQKFLAKHGSASGAVSLECSCMPFRGRDYKGNCHILARTSPSRNCVCSRTDLSLTISGDYPGAVERARRLDPFVQVDPARDFRGFRGTPAGFPRYFVTGEFAVRQLALILGLISLSFQSSGVGLNWGRFEFYAPYIRALGARGTSHPLAPEFYIEDVLSGLESPPTETSEARPSHATAAAPRMGARSRSRTISP